MSFVIGLTREEAISTGLPILTGIELRKRTIEDRKIYLTIEKAALLKIEEFGKGKTPIAIYNSGVSFLKNHYYIFDYSDDFPLIDELGEFHINGVQFEKLQDDNLQSRFEFIGLFFNERYSTFVEVYSAEKFAEKKKYYPIPSHEIWHVTKKDLSPHTSYLKGIKPVGYKLEGGEFVAYYDTKEICKNNGLTFFDVSDVVYPYVLIEQLKSKKWKKEEYLGHEVGFTVTKGGYVLSVYHLSDLANSYGMSLMTKKALKDGETKKYLTRAKLNYFPEGWKVAKDLLQVGFLEDGMIIYEIPGEISGYFDLVTSVTTMNILIPYDKLSKFVSRVKSDGFDINQIEPVGITDDLKFVFDTNSSDEFKRYRTRYAMNPLLF